MEFFFAVATRQFPVAFLAVYGVGFVIAVFVGLIALYNSKRPVGLEDSERPSIIPKITLPQDGRSPSQE